MPTSWDNLPSGYLSNDELQLLQAIRTLILDNNNGTVSNSDYNTQVNALVANTSNLNQMKIAPSVLKIAVASGDYWVVQGNEEPTPSGIAPWVAADAAGALLGATRAAPCRRFCRRDCRGRSDWCYYWFHWHSGKNSQGYYALFFLTRLL